MQCYVLRRSFAKESLSTRELVTRPDSQNCTNDFSVATSSKTRGGCNPEFETTSN